MGWTNIDEGLPELNEHVLVCNKKGWPPTIYIARRVRPMDNAPVMWVDDDYQDCAVGYWMPLPELPNERR